MGDLTGLRAPQGTDAIAHSSVNISSDSSARAAIRLKDYEIKGVIGEGGIGVVYRARHLVSDKPVAIKVLHEYCGRQKDLVEKLFVVAKAVSRIHQPNITDVTDFGTAPDGSVFVATDYLVGESLEDRLRRVHRLPLFEAINIVRQVAHGLGAAHEVGIVHRDLKPANIFLCSREGRRRIVRRSKETGMRFTIVPEKTFDLVKLLDFGAASFIDFDPSAQTPAEVVCRRPYYLSPEQIQGRPTDQRCDIYALGAVFYQMVTGTIPVSGETVPAIINALATGSVTAPSRRTPEAGTSLRIDNVILKCLNRNPSLRFASAAELCAALDQCLGDCAYLRDAHRLPGIQFSGIDLSQASLEARQDVMPATPDEPPAEPIAKGKVAPQTIALGTLLHEARAATSRLPRPDIQSVPKKTDAKREAQVSGQPVEIGEKLAPTKGAEKVIVVSGALAQVEATVAKPPAEPIAKAASVGPKTIAWGTFLNEARASASRLPRPNVQSVPKKADAKREAQVDGQRVGTGEGRAPTKGVQKVIVVSGAPARVEATVAATPAIVATPALEKHGRSPAPRLVAIGGAIAIGGVLMVGLVIAFWPKRDGASRTAQPAATMATPASTPAAPERPAAIAPAAAPVAPAPSAPAASAAAPIPAVLPAVPATAPAVVAPEAPPAPAVRAAAPQGEKNTIRVAKAASSASHRAHHKKERGAVAVSARGSDEPRSPTAEPAATAEVIARRETEPESAADPFEGSMGSPTGSSLSVEDRMREAQRASRTGHHKSAIRKARAVLKAEPKPGLVMQAYQIIATSSCALGKVAGAREAASHLGKQALAAVRAACKKDGVRIE
jgi:serine/threonine protein kinase